MKEILPEKFLSLPTVELRDRVMGDQMIEGNEGKIHYEITKVKVLRRSKIIIYSLSTSGPEKERQEFVRQMKEMLGEPFNNNQQFPGDPNFYTFWEADRVEERLRKISPCN